MNNEEYDRKLERKTEEVMRGNPGWTESLARTYAIEILRLEKAGEDAELRKIEELMKKVKLRDTERGR